MDTRKEEVYNNSPMEMSDHPEPIEKSPSHLKNILSKHAARSSVNGLSYIQGSKNAFVKTIWVFLLMGAIVGMVYHLHSLISTYLEYSKSSKITFGFNELAFPAVSFCNINPLRYPLRSETSDLLQDIIDKSDPAKLQKLAEAWTPETDSDGHRTSNFLDDFEFEGTLDELDYSDSTFSDSWESEGSTSTLNAVYDEFLRIYNQENATTRASIGHQIRDMLIQCAFKGRQCYQNNFTRFNDGHYGNCYTISYEKFVAKKSGPGDGLELILNLETDEYLPGLTLGKGVQMVIHEKDTMPFPFAQGIAINAGTETRIGMVMRDIQRIGLPHAPDCTSNLGETFKSDYDLVYSRKACQSFCEQRRVGNQCGCYNEIQQLTNTYLRKFRGLPPCRTKKQRECAASNEASFASGAGDCACNSPCNERDYDLIISQRQWPGEAFANVLKDSVCQDRGNVKCDALGTKTPYDMQQEFLKVIIYYKDLNYELIEEQADYADDQFYSDIGGVIGLWIGLSLLSVMELVHLVMDLSYNICCCIKGSGNKDKKKQRYQPEPIHMSTKGDPGSSNLS